jgi:Fur family transcriptional regulator, ferric uptake regulator
MAPHADLDALLGRLRDEGSRVTTARRLVLAALVDAGGEHPTADDLGQRIQASNPEVHLSTVYRTLESLEQAGLVVRAGFRGAAATYHLADDHHHHAQCDGCGAEVELPHDAFAAVIARLRRDHGFVASPHHLVIGGRCRDCVDLPAPR